MPGLRIYIDDNPFPINTKGDVREACDFIAAYQRMQAKARKASILEQLKEAFKEFISRVMQIRPEFLNEESESIIEEAVKSSRDMLRSLEDEDDRINLLAHAAPQCAKLLHSIQDFIVLYDTTYPEALNTYISSLKKAVQKSIASPQEATP